MTWIVAFDFDGTLTKKDTFIEFIKFSKGRLEYYLFSPLLFLIWISYKIGLVKVDTAKQFVFSIFFKGMPVSEFDDHSEAFKDEINKILMDDAETVIHHHVSENRKTVIVSASIENWIVPWAKSMGIQTVIATKLEIDENGLLTGKFSTKNCNGQEKVNRFIEFFGNKEAYNLVVYGNSIGDKPLMKLADKKYYKTLK